MLRRRGVGTSGNVHDGGEGGGGDGRGWARGMVRRRGVGTYMMEGREGVGVGRGARA